MATKSSTKDTKKKTSKKSTQKHDLVYIMSNSCGWCKKADPLVKELTDDGYKIPTLDVMNPDEGKRANELKQKYNVHCGTPLFIDCETGNQICGFREKDVLEKWAKGEEIPKPPQPKGMPPRPPMDIATAPEAEMAEFKKGYEEWAANNKHLPNVLTFDQAVERIKAGQAAQKQAGVQAGQPQSQAVQTTASRPDTRFEPTKNNAYYYIIENGERVAVFASTPKINDLKAQYYVFEEQGPQKGRLTKVTGDQDWTRAFAPTVPAPQNNVKQPPTPAPTKEVDKKVKEQIDKVKQASKAKKEQTTAKSKTNKKTIESF